MFADASKPLPLSSLLFNYYAGKVTSAVVMVVSSEDFSPFSYCITRLMYLWESSILSYPLKRRYVILGFLILDLGATILSFLQQISRHSIYEYTVGAKRATLQGFSLFVYIKDGFSCIKMMYACFVPFFFFCLRSLYQNMFKFASFTYALYTICSYVLKSYGFSQCKHCMMDTIESEDNCKNCL